MYNPRDAGYLDELSVRHEISRVFDVCSSCQICVDVCDVFPQVFSFMAGQPVGGALLMTPAHQDQVLESCHMCMQCVVQCPYGGIAQVDADTSHMVRVPELVVRHRSMLWSLGVITFSERLHSWRISFSPLLIRMRKSVQRISGGFRERQKLHSDNEQVVFFPTCVVERHEPQIAQNFVDVCNVAGMTCSVDNSFTCCGAPALYAGDLARFGRIAKRNLSGFASIVATGRKIVVGEPACTAVMKQFYPSVARTSDADLVLNEVTTIHEFLARELPTGSSADLLAVESVTHVVSLTPSVATFAESHLPPASDNPPQRVARNIWEIPGVDVSVVRYASFADTEWSGQRRFDDVSARATEKLVADIEATVARHGSDLENSIVVGESCLTNARVTERLGRQVFHPVSVLARIVRHRRGQ